MKRQYVRKFPGAPRPLFPAGKRAAMVGTLVPIIGLRCPRRRGWPTAMSSGDGLYEHQNASNKSCVTNPRASVLECGAPVPLSIADRNAANTQDAP